MNHTPLLEAERRRLGTDIALAPYLGDMWELAAFYARPSMRSEAVASEYDALTGTSSAGVYDSGWRRWVELTGRDRSTFLHGMVSNDITALTPGKGRRAAMLNQNGHIMVDLTVYALPDSLMIGTDPRRLPRLLETLEKFLISEKVTIKDVSSDWTAMTIGGRGTDSLLHRVAETVRLPSESNSHRPVQIAGSSGHLLRTGSRGSATFDLLVPTAAVEEAWETIVDAGARPVGHAAFETLRIEAGDPAWGSELDESVLFPEVELAEAVSYTKGCYVGQEIVARIRARGHTNRSLRGILFEHGAHSLQPGDQLFPASDENSVGQAIGRITSAAISPKHDGRLLALGYVRREFATEGGLVVCRYAHREAYGEVLVPPFARVSE